jgi:lipopolysaccharide assembly protein A
MTMQRLFVLLKTAVGVSIFLLLLGFAVKNTDLVALRYFLGLEWQAPLVLMLLLFFSAGAALGVAATMGMMVRQRREILALKRELRGLTRPAGVPIIAESI